MRHLNKLIVLTLLCPAVVFAADLPEEKQDPAVQHTAEQPPAEQQPMAQPPAEQAPSIQLQSRLAAVRSLHAMFEQLSLDSQGNLIQSSEGELWLSSADQSAKFRIETKLPFEQLLISDGVDFWSYDAALEQVVVSKLDQDVSRMPILLFGNSDQALLSKYQLTFFEDETSQYFVLEPNATDSLFDMLTIVFMDATPIEISLRDSLGQQTKIKFINPGLNAEIPDDRFEFQTPDDIDVIDDR